MLETLTLRQIQIMELLALGGNNDHLADTLQISVQTVKVHMWRLCQKLGVNSRTEAVALWRNAQMEAEQANMNQLREANQAMLSALQWLADNRDAEPIAITGVLARAIAAGTEGASAQSA